MAASANSPKLTKDQVAKEFATFGYKPDERDLTWWATQDASAHSKLVANLKARRDNDRKAIKEKAKQAAAQKAIKDSQTAAIAGSQARGSSTDKPTTSTPTSSASQTVVSNIGGKSKLYPMGEYSLVKFNDNPAVFLVDVKNKELRPFLTEEALRTSFDNPEEAMRSIVNMDAAEHTQQGGALSDFEFLPYEYGISNNGVMKEKDYRLNNLKDRYGQSEIPIETAVKTAGNISMFLSSLKNNPSSKIDPAFIDKIKNDANLGVLYGVAAQYGGYTFADIYKDIKKREASEKGDHQYDNMKFIDDKMTKSQYIKTNEGQASSKNLLFEVPKEFSDVNPELFELQVTQLPDDAFKTLVPALNVESPEFKADAAKIQSAFHDVLMQKLSAQTDEDKAVADHDWNTFKKELEDSYNIKLSNNAVQAWEQVQKIGQQAIESGISGSGIEAENIDDYLKSVRKNNESLRKSEASTEATEEEKYYKSFASPDQIKALMAEDQAKGLPRDQWRVTQWGLLPNQETIDALDINTLKQKYPGESEEALKSYRDQVIDENGLVRSTLYSNKIKQQQSVLLGRKPMEEELTQGKSDFQKSQLLQQNLEAEKKAEKEYTQKEAENIFSGPDAGIAKPTPTQTPTTTTGTTTPTSATPTTKETTISSIYPGGVKPGTRTPINQTFTQPSNASISTAFSTKKPATNPWAPTDKNKVKISGPSQIGQYNNIEKNPTAGSLDLWGTPKPKVQPRATPTIKPAIKPAIKPSVPAAKPKTQAPMQSKLNYTPMPR